MPSIGPILDEMEREAKTTRRVLERVPTESFSWKPHPKSKSLLQLSWHLASIPYRVARLAQTDDGDAMTVKEPPPPASTAELIAAFDSHVAEAKELLSKQDGDSLSRIFTFRRGDIVMAKIPKIGFLRAVLLNHSYHHRGQLSVYLRLLDVPLPPIYGPTADETV